MDNDDQPGRAPTTRQCECDNPFNNFNARPELFIAGGREPVNIRNKALSKDSIVAASGSARLWETTVDNLSAV
jgi:hypothetical protein